jgi:hypothetical protein
MFVLRRALQQKSCAQAPQNKAWIETDDTVKETQAINVAFGITSQEFLVCKVTNVSFVVQDAFFQMNHMEYLHKNPIWCIVQKSKSAQGFWKVTSEDFTYSLDFPIRPSGNNPLTEVVIKLNYDCPISRADVLVCDGVFPRLDEAIDLLHEKIRDSGSHSKGILIRENERATLAAKLGVDPDDINGRKAVLSQLRRPIKQNPAWGPTLDVARPKAW